MQARGAILVDALHLGHEQIALAEEGPNRELICGGSPAQDATGEIDGAEREVSEQRGGEIDLPSLGLDLDNPTDDKVTDFWSVAGAQWADR